MDLKQLCQEIVQDLLGFDFLEHVRGNAGLLSGESHYRSIFMFKPKEEQTRGKMYQLIGFLQKQTYKTSFLFKEHEAVRVTREEEAEDAREERVKTGLLMIVLTSRENTPQEQENSLVYDLHALKKYLRDYKQKKHVA